MCVCKSNELQIMNTPCTTQKRCIYIDVDICICIYIHIDMCMYVNQTSPGPSKRSVNY